MNRRRGRNPWRAAAVAMALIAAAAHASVARAAIVSLPATTNINGTGAAADIAVSIDDAAQVEAVDLQLGFDGGTLTVTGDVSLAAITSGCTAASNRSVPGSLRIALACPAALAGSGPLLTIPVAGAGAGSTALTLTVCELNEGSLPCTAVSGVVNVATPTPTATATATRTATSTATRTFTRTATPSATPTSTRTATFTRTATPTRTATRTGTPTSTATASGTATPSATPTYTLGPTPVEREPRARALITSYYTDILGRAPEAGAVDSWYNGYFLTAVNQSIDVRFVPSEMGRLFFASQEYANRNRTNAEFITDCYQVFLRRQPSTGELNAWLADQSWNRPQVVATFAQSAEFGNYIQGQFPGLTGTPARNLVTVMYIGLLDRLVDAAGLSFFAGVFENAYASSGIEGVRSQAASLGRQVFASAEYLGKNPTNATHVQRLYRAYLGRFPSTSELSYWTGELNAGRQTTDSLVTAFSSSNEFTNILNANFH
jgi:hypothetical protein